MSFTRNICRKSIAWALLASVFTSIKIKALASLCYGFVRIGAIDRTHARILVSKVNGETQRAPCACVYRTALMANNIFVCVELLDDAAEVSHIDRALEEFSDICRVTLTTWYVSTSASAAEVATKLWNVMSSVDRLLVIDATEGSAAMFNIGDGLVQTMRDCWHAHGDRLRAVSPPDAASA